MATLKLFAKPLRKTCGKPAEKSEEKCMLRFFKSLFGQVVLALIVGVLVGLFASETAVALKPLGDGFIKLVKML